MRPSFCCKSEFVALFLRREISMTSFLSTRTNSTGSNFLPRKPFARLIRSKLACRTRSSLNSLTFSYQIQMSLHKPFSARWLRGTTPWLQEHVRISLLTRVVITSSVFDLSWTMFWRPSVGPNAPKFGAVACRRVDAAKYTVGSAYPFVHNAICVHNQLFRPVRM